MSKPSTTDRDQMLAFLEDGLTGAIVGVRELRESRAERFSKIDSFRITRDTAEVLMANYDPHQISLMLSGALHRLAQMEDFEPFNDLADLDFVIPPEGE